MTLPHRTLSLMIAIAATVLAPGCRGSLTPTHDDAGGTGLGGGTIMTGSGGAV